MMWKNITLDKCYSFIQSEFRPKDKTLQLYAKPAVTISRMTGAGGHTVASILAEYLQMRIVGHEPWTVFDQNLVEEVLEDHQIQERITDFMEEGHKSLLKDAVELWIGSSPNSWTVVQWINATILRLAQAGNVIIVGRGATVIAGKVETAFHVRLIASLENRIERVQQAYGIDRKTALDYIKKKDAGRRRYLKAYLGADIDDPFLYHLTINMDTMGFDEAAALIGEEILRRFRMKTVIKGAGTETELSHP
jgi:cytidylate kinase